MRSLDTGNRRRFEYIARHQPTKPLRQHAERPVSHVRSVERDMLRECNHVTASNLMDAAPVPSWQHDALKDVFGLCCRARARLAFGVQLDELLSEGFNAV